MPRFPLFSRGLRPLLALTIGALCLLLPSLSRAATTNPLAGDSFYVNPSSTAQTQLKALQASGDTADGAQVEKIAAQSTGIWLTSDSAAATTKIQTIMSDAAAAGQTPVLVAENLPWRNCGGGGATGISDYESYINGIVAGLGQAKAVIVLEPNGLGELQCLTSAEQQTYDQLLRYAVQRLDTDSAAAVYVDAGNPGWHPASVMGGEVEQVLSGTRAGFALNVASYYSTASLITYGTAVSQAAGGAHFVLDTSRNGGNAEKNQWCNAPGAGLGTAPTTSTGNPLLDAELWIKPPGESDGACNGGPSGGTFWVAYAEDLLADGIAPPSSSSTTSTTTTTADPLAGDSFYVNPHDTAANEERTLLAAGETGEAAQVEKIAAHAEAIWLTSDSAGATTNVQGIMSAASAADQVPVLVAYDLPWRDCGGLSAGGASSAQDYESYIGHIAAGIGQAKVAIVLEPDALGELQCLPASEQQTYDQLLRYAVLHLTADRQASVYVDAGNPGWHPASLMASRLEPVITGTHAGFSLNVSNYYSTASSVTYGSAISNAAGGAHFVLDTSRNGGSAEKNQWCNAPGAGLGTAPTTSTGNPLLDAELWIKPPGESDGQCNGGPAPGTFWLAYALDLITNQQ